MLVLLRPAARAQTALPIFTDHLVNGFQSWSWATVNFTNSAPVYPTNAAASISVLAPNYGGLWLHHSDFSTALYTSLSFWIHGGTNGGQLLVVNGTLDGGSGSSYTLPALTANTWRQFTVPLSALGVAGKTNCTGFEIQSTSSGSVPVFYVSAVQLNAAAAPALTHLTVNAGQTLRAVDARWFGLNTAVWDSLLTPAGSAYLLKEMGTLALRFPGGSLSDEYHWASNKSLTNTWTWNVSFANFAQVATNVGAQTFITVNYGTGTAAEAAAWVANANVTNHYGFKYWEVGNEVYGTWETDSNAVPNDPFTYATRAQGYFQQMKAVDPTIKIGVVATPGDTSGVNNMNHSVVNPRTLQTVYGWTPVMLNTLSNLGVVPDFLIYHHYPEYTDTESDPFLLQTLGTWAGDAATLRQELTDFLGTTNGAKVEIVCTENNSNSGDQGRQSVSLVNGLYYADSVGQIMQTELNSMVWWDLRNGTDNKGNLDPVLYGWRLYGDLGLVGGTSTRYPPFYAAKLLQSFARPGDNVIAATNDYPLLSAYATRRADGAVSVLAINKDPAATITAQIHVTGFLPATNAAYHQFGETQDTAAQTGVGSPDVAAGTTNVAGTNFNYSFPPYSLTVLTLAPAPPRLVATGPVVPGQSAPLQLQGQTGVRYFVQASTNLAQWTTFATNTLTAATWNITNAPALPASRQYYRAVWQP